MGSKIVHVTFFCSQSKEALGCVCWGNSLTPTETSHSAIHLLGYVLVILLRRERGRKAAEKGNRIRCMPTPPDPPPSMGFTVPVPPLLHHVCPLPFSPYLLWWGVGTQLARAEKLWFSSQCSRSTPCIAWKHSIAAFYSSLRWWNKHTTSIYNP